VFRAARIATLLLAIFSFVLITPALAPADTDAKLPT
jgi:hypothetical protein